MSHLQPCVRVCVSIVCEHDYICLNVIFLILLKNHFFFFLISSTDDVVFLTANAAAEAVRARNVPEGSSHQTQGENLNFFYIFLFYLF